MRRENFIHVSTVGYGWKWLDLEVFQLENPRISPSLIGLFRQVKRLGSIFGEGSTDGWCWGLFQSEGLFGLVDCWTAIDW